MNIEDLEVAEWEWVFSLISPQGKVVRRYKLQGDAEAQREDIHGTLLQIGLSELITGYRITRRKRATKFWIGPEEDVND